MYHTQLDLCVYVSSCSYAAFWCDVTMYTHNQACLFAACCHRRDECDRVKKFGARVLTLDQVYGVKDPSIECWGTEEEDGGDPPRLWAPNGNYPGTAFTRSIGDNGGSAFVQLQAHAVMHVSGFQVADVCCCFAAAETIGVCAEPELAIRNLTPANPFFLIGSDGIFEFMPSQTVVDMVSACDNVHAYVTKARPVSCLRYTT